MSLIWCKEIGKYISVKDNGNILFSRDGEKWGVNNKYIGSWRSVVWNGEIAVTVASCGKHKIAWSKNGEEWNMVENSGESCFTGIAYGNGIFVAVSDSGFNRVSISNNGKEWEHIEAPIYPWKDIAFNSGGFVAVGIGHYMTSIDGKEWECERLGDYCKLIDIAPWKNDFISVGSGCILKSNGKKWEINNHYDHLIGIATNDTLAVSIAEDKIALSSDGDEWASFHQLGNWSGVVWNNEHKIFLIVSENKIVKIGNDAKDNIILTPIDIINDHREMFSLAEKERTIVAVSPYDGYGAMYSKNGSEWKVVDEIKDTQWRSVCVFKNKFIVAGTGVCVSGDGIKYNLYRNSGNWKSCDGNDNIVVAVGSTGIIYSHDGVLWDIAINDALSPWKSVVWCSHINLFIAVGTLKVATSSDGRAWNISNGSIAFNKIVCHNNTIVAISSDNKTYNTTSGVEWYTAVVPSTLAYADIIWNTELKEFIIFNIDKSDEIYFSSDGKKWEARKLDREKILRGLFWFDNKYIVIEGEK